MMKEKSKLILIFIILVMIVLFIFTYQENIKLNSYLEEDNSNRISGVFARLSSIHEYFDKNNKVEEFEESDLSWIGLCTIECSNDIHNLYRQSRYLNDENYLNHEKINRVQKFLNSTSKYISMDILNTVGNHYPLLYSKGTVDLSEDDISNIEVIDAIFEEIDKYIINEFASDSENSRKYRIDYENNYVMNDIKKIINEIVRIFETYEDKIIF
ncbi:hypothetical protein QUF55_05610 [Clostridiaceae bacterium HSG29]|nr:hypothetical protein [Clostridiaceae bacterium HSG29]